MKTKASKSGSFAGNLRIPDGECTTDIPSGYSSANPNKGASAKRKSNDPDFDAFVEEPFVEEPEAQLLESVDKELDDEKTVQLKAAIKLHIEPTPEQKSLLFALGRSVQNAQVYIMTDLLRGLTQGPPESWAYPRMTNRIKEWRQWLAKRQYDDAESIEKRRHLDATWIAGSGVVSINSRSIVNQYREWYREMMYVASPPWPKQMGFTVRGASIKISKSEPKEPRKSKGKKPKEESGFVLVKMSLLGRDEGSTRNPQQPVFRAFPHGANDWANMRAILSGKIATKTCRVFYKRGSKEWWMSLSYERPQVQKSRGQPLYVIRGIGRFLTGMYADGSYTQKFETVDSLVRIKRQFAARRAAIRTDHNHRGSGAHGHGKDRRYREYRRLSEKEENFVNTWCQRHAAHLVNEAEKRGCCEVVLEDFHADDYLYRIAKAKAMSEDEKKKVARPEATYFEKMLKSFPFAKLRSCIEWSCQKRGMYLRLVPGTHVAKCPKCAGAMKIDASFRLCTCGLVIGVDTLALWWLAKEAGGDVSVFERKAGYQKSLWCKMRGQTDVV